MGEPHISCSITSRTHQLHILDLGENMITLMEILLKWITPKPTAAEQNNYRRSKQIHFEDLLK